MPRPTAVIVPGVSYVKRNLTGSFSHLYLEISQNLVLPLVRSIIMIKFDWTHEELQKIVDYIKRDFKMKDM